MDAIDRSAALHGARRLRRALAHLDMARHDIDVAAAESDACDATDILVPLASIMTYLSIRIAIAEAEAQGTDKPYPKLRLVK